MMIDDDDDDDDDDHHHHHHHRHHHYYAIINLTIIITYILNISSPCVYIPPSPSLSSLFLVAQILWRDRKGGMVGETAASPLPPAAPHSDGG